MLDLNASLPPRSITEFPDLIQSPAASAVTFGIASYIIPITPRGTLTLDILRPFGRFILEIASPIGSAIQQFGVYLQPYLLFWLD